MSNVVVVGAQWGDEGKGKVVDLLTEFADVVVRYQGGANAGHTLVVNGVTTILHHIPSGVLHPGKTSVLGNGMVVNPPELVREIEALRARGFLSSAGELYVSGSAHVILPYHMAVDGAREDRAAGSGAKIGTTRRGIGPAYEDKIGRRGIRMSELLEPERFEELVERVLPEKNALLSFLGGAPVRYADFAETYRAAAEALRPFVTDTGRLLAREAHRGKNLLFEGAQGTLLDVDHGTYPYVTSSTTVAAGAASGAGLGPRVLDTVIGISKAYTTRVGEGPFPTEDSGELGETLRREGKEYGATTGRARRCGWLDVAGLRAARRLNGLTGLALTKLDVLGGHKKLKICIGYRRGSEKSDELPGDLGKRGGWVPEYEELEGWAESVREVRELDDLPRNARRYIERVEEMTELPVLLVSIGPARGETIVRKNPFRP
jgi:adenylosuccinate synthase